MNISIIKVFVLLLLPVIYKVIYLYSASEGTYGRCYPERAEIIFHQATISYYYLLEFAFIGGTYVITNNCILNKGIMTSTFWVVIAVFGIAAIIHMVVANDVGFGYHINFAHMLVATVMLIIVLCIIFYLNGNANPTETMTIVNATK